MTKRKELDPREPQNQIWIAAHDGAWDRRSGAVPGPGITKILFVLCEQPEYGHQLARLTELSQVVVRRHLRRLDQLGFAYIDFVIGGGRAGGRPAEYWRLTPKGRALVASLRRDGALKVAA